MVRHHNKVVHQGGLDSLNQINNLYNTNETTLGTFRVKFVIKTGRRYQRSWTTYFPWKVSINELQVLVFSTRHISYRSLGTHSTALIHTAFLRLMAAMAKAIADPSLPSRPAPTFASTYVIGKGTGLSTPYVLSSGTAYNPRPLEHLATGQKSRTQDVVEFRSKHHQPIIWALATAPQLGVA